MNDATEITNTLLKKISEGNNNAFRIFFDCYYPKVNRFVSYLIKYREIKEEVVSDVFFSIWQQKDKLTKVKDLDAFLYTIARNRAIDYIRQSSYSVKTEQISLGIAVSEKSPEVDLINKELHEEIIKAVNSLPEKCKLIFLMAKEQGLKYREIADVLKISEKTVNSQMVIALKRMSSALAKYMSIVFFLTHSKWVMALYAFFYF